MSRGLSAALKTAVAARNATFVELLYANFSGGDLYLTTASQDITTPAGTPLTGSQTWTAVGGALSVAQVPERGAFEVTEVEVKLSAVDTSIVTALLSNNYRGRNIRVWLLCLNDTTGAVVDTVERFRGRMTGGFSVTEERGGDQPTATISLRCFDWLADLMQRRGIVTNQESHQLVSTGDTFFAIVPLLQLRRVTWGNTTFQKWSWLKTAELPKRLR